MKIKFLKDHLQNKAGDVVDDHLHAEYLVRMGVAEDTNEKVEKTGNKKEKANIKKPATKKKN